jgi:membrane-bound ClpP family serine protease
LSVDDRQDGGNHFLRSPTGPAVAPPRKPIDRPAPPLPAAGSKRRLWSVAFFVLLISGVGIRAYRDLARPEAWDYWKDQYVSPSLTSSLIGKVDLGPDRRWPALAIRGPIGPAAASWFRDRIDEAHLVAGDVVLLSSPGGDLNQAAIMGEIIRSRGLVTAVGVADASGAVRPSYCASACVLVYAGGKTRYGVPGSALGVHRFVTTRTSGDPVAETQRIAGAVLGYMTKMGISSSVVEAMSENKDIRWLGPREALAMNLVTVPPEGP